MVLETNPYEVQLVELDMFNLQKRILRAATNISKSLTYKRNKEMACVRTKLRKMTSGLNLKDKQPKLNIKRGFLHQQSPTFADWQPS